MRQRVPLLVLLGSALAFLPSLYLPWQTAPGKPCGLGCHQSALSLDGWAFGIGYAAAILAVALAGSAIATLLRPGWARRLPLARCAFGLGYLAVAVAAAVRLEGNVFGTDRHVHWAYGSYLGLAASALAVCAATALRARLARRLPASTLVSGLLGLGLLASFLLPWFRSGDAGHTFSQPGVVDASALLAALVVLFAATGGAGRLAATAATVLLTASAFHPSPSQAPRAYGAWLGLSLALALLVSAAVATRGSLRRPARTDATWAAVAAAGTAFVVSLFLPWQTLCPPPSAIGRCFSESGWTPAGSVAALIVVAVVAVPALWRRRIWISEATVAVALLVATVGLAGTPLGDLRLAYGALVGFVAAGAFVLLALRRARLARLDPGRVAVRVIPVTACVLLVLGVLIPGWALLPADWSSQAGVLAEWFAVAGLLLSLHLLAAWLPVDGAPAPGERVLTLTPLALLALVVLAIVRERSQGLTWGGGIMMGLCLFLLLLGWSEEKQGLERLRVPDVLRLDRLPETES